VERLEILQIAGSLIECRAGLLQLRDQETRQGGHENQRSRVHGPERCQNRGIDRPARRFDQIRLPGQQDGAVGQSGQPAAGERCMALKQHRGVDHNDDVQEREDRVAPARKQHERAHQDDVRGDVDGGEEPRPVDSPHERPIDQRRKERHHDRHVEALPLTDRDVAAERVEAEADGQTHHSEPEPRSHQDHEVAFKTLVAPRQPNRAGGHTARG
jgi:hypothetical protein